MKNISWNTRKWAVKLKEHLVQNEKTICVALPATKLVLFKIALHVGNTYATSK